MVSGHHRTFLRLNGCYNDVTAITMTLLYPSVLNAKNKACEAALAEKQQLQAMSDEKLAAQEALHLKELARLTSQCGDIVRDREEQVTSLQAQNAAAEENLSVLEQALADGKSALADAALRLQSALHENDGLKREIVGAKAAAEAAEAERDSLAARYEAMVSSFEELEQQAVVVAEGAAAAAEAKRASLAVDLQRAESELAKFALAAAEQDEMRANWEAEIAAIKAQHLAEVCQLRSLLQSVSNSKEEQLTSLRAANEAAVGLWQRGRGLWVLRLLSPCSQHRQQQRQRRPSVLAWLCSLRGRNLSWHLSAHGLRFVNGNLDQRRSNSSLLGIGLGG